MGIEKAKRIIDESDVVVILTGAGMSADSGLATFRPNDGRKPKKCLSYEELTTQEAFNEKNRLAWAFHGLSFNEYKKTKPHEGYHLLLDLVKQKEDHFVVTSNIDSAHHKSGFKNVYEIHGRLNKFQCLDCGNLWKAPRNTKFIVGENYDLKSDVPKCVCGGKARPNIMFFGYDLGFDKTETQKQSEKFNKFMRKYDKGDHKIALIEIGAGEAVRSIRNIGEFIHKKVKGATLIRINPTDNNVYDDRMVSVKMSALDAIKSLIN